MTQVIELVVVAPVALPALPCAIDIAAMTEAEFLTFALSPYRDKRDPWQMNAAQMEEIEDERIGADVIAPYIFF